MGELRVMDQKGDIKTVWDPENEDECQAAEKQFNNLINKKFLAFKVKKTTGNKGAQITKFDPNAGRIIMSPPIVGG